MNKKEVLSYYKNADFSNLFTLEKDFFKFKQLRFLCEGKNGALWHTGQDQIKNADDLKNYIIKLINRNIVPQKCYYMPAQFISPRDVMGEKTKSPFLGFDWIVFDFDLDKIIIENPLGKVEEMRLQTLKLISFMEKKAFKLFYICKSGQRGIHIAMRLPIWEQRGDKENYLNYFKSICEQIKKEGIEIDATTTLQSDLQGIWKIPLTISINTPCSFIQLDSLESFQKFEKAMKGGSHPIPRTKLKQAQARTRVRASPHLFQAREIVSNVNGTKNRHALFLDYDNQTEVFVHRQLLRLIRTYKLSSFGMFKTKQGYQAVCAQSIEWPRLKKILKVSKCDWGYIRMYQNKGFLTLRVSAKKDLITGRIISPKPKFLKLITGNKNNLCSKTHLAYLQSFTDIEEKNLCGNGELTTIQYSGEK